MPRLLTRRSRGTAPSLLSGTRRGHPDARPWRSGHTPAPC